MIIYQCAVNCGHRTTSGMMTVNSTLESSEHNTNLLHKLGELNLPAILNEN